MQRRNLIKSIGILGALNLTLGCASTSKSNRGTVIVVGGGYGGATAAKYIRLWSDNAINVTLIEPNEKFISCPLSNLVLGGSKQLDDLTVSYDSLQKRHGVKVVRDLVKSIDTSKKTVRTSGGQSIRYDKLVLSPGVDFMWETLPSIADGNAQSQIIHAWKAGPQTATLRKQLVAMQDGGTFVIAIPLAPYRCPPGPYERACQVAHYFSKSKPRSKVLILDSNDDVTSKGPLFKKIWAERYKGIIEYQPKFVTSDLDIKTNTLISDFGDKISGTVLNLIPSQRAGLIAQTTGLANLNKRWCEVDYSTFESTQSKDIHILGDAIQVAPLMPKSGHMANQHAKICAAAIVDVLNDRVPNKAPLINNTCYSFTTDSQAIHVASVHRYDIEKKTYLVVPGASGVSTSESEVEGLYAMSWARNIWADSLI